MPCEVNSILRLSRSQGYPDPLVLGQAHEVTKSGYRIFPLDVPIQLVDTDWIAHADVIISQLTWHDRQTEIRFEVVRLYELSFPLK